MGRSTDLDVEALWVITDATIERWAVSDTGYMLQVMVLETANTMAQGVDEGGDYHWLLAWDGTVRSYNFEGVELASETPATAPSGGDSKGLGVDVSDGSVRVGFGTKLYHYAQDGSLVRTTTLGSAFKALAVDAKARHAIVVTADTIIAIHSDTGSTVFTISQSAGTAVAVDQRTGEFFVTFAGALRQYSSTGVELGSYSNSSLNSSTHVGVDGLGGAWVASGANLYGFDVALTNRASLTPFGGNTISALATDFLGGEVWVAFSTSARGYSVSGSLLGYESADDDIVSLAVATHGGDDQEQMDSTLGSGLRISADSSQWIIDSIWNDSPAEQEGLENGDIVEAINGIAVPSIPTTVQDLEDFHADVLTARIGGVDEYEVVRDSVPLVFTPTLLLIGDVYRTGATTGTIGSFIIRPPGGGTGIKRCRQCFSSVCWRNEYGFKSCQSVNGGAWVCPGEPTCGLWN